eukprot:TCONS_00062175-protein
MKRILFTFLLQFLQVIITHQSCQPRDDQYGHYTCIKGHKECLPNWYDPSRNCLETCSIPTDDRKDCGFHGIDKQHCIAKKGCCWKENHENRKIPWCFHGKYVAPPPTQPPSTTPSSSSSSEPPSISSTKSSTTLSPSSTTSTIPPTTSSLAVKPSFSKSFLLATSSSANDIRPSSSHVAALSSSQSTRFQQSSSTKLEPSSSTINVVKPSSTKSIQQSSPAQKQTSSVLISSNSQKILKPSSTKSRTKYSPSSTKEVKSTPIKHIQPSTNVLVSSSSTIKCHTQQIISTITVTKLIKQSCSNQKVQSTQRNSKISNIYQTSTHIQPRKSSSKNIQPSSSVKQQQQQNSCINTGQLGNSDERIAGVEKTPMLIIIILGVLLLFFMIVSIFLFCKEQRLKKRYEKFESGQFALNFKNPVFADKAMNIYE